MSQAMQSIFDEIDASVDGRLSMKEVEKATFQRKAEFKLKPAIAMHAFQKADVNMTNILRMHP